MCFAFNLHFAVFATPHSMNQQRQDLDAYLKRKFSGVLKNLKKANLDFEDICHWKEEVWEKFAGVGVGNTIFNYLHPQAIVPTAALQELESIEEDVNLQSNREYQNYFARGEVLKYHQLVTGLSQMVSALNGAIMPFIFIEASSGHGKTQMAFNLMALGRHIIYFVCTPVVDDSQEIYKCFTQRASVLQYCLDEDLKIINGSGVSELKVISQCRLFGLIYALLEEKPFKGSVTRKKLVQKLVGKDPIIFLDEFPKLRQEGTKNVERLRYLRNIFRSLGLKVITASTNSSAHNLVVIIQQSSVCDPFHWCTIISRLPSFQPSAQHFVQLNNLSQLFQNLIKNTRPRFSQQALNYLSCNPNSSLDDICKELYDKATTSKGETREFLVGQVCLFLSASYQDNEQQGGAEVSPLIDSHFADLVEDNAFQLFLGGRKLCKENESRPWKPIVAFKAMKDDLLLYLALMGGKERQPFVIEGEPQLFHVALHEARLRQAIFFNSSNQTSNDGMELEACSTAALTIASHIGGFKGIGLAKFLQEFVLQMNGVSVNNIDLPIEFANYIVPFLSPPNQAFPTWFNSNDINVANLTRTRNRDMIDFGVYKSTLINGPSRLISGESKDYKARLNLDVVENILLRVPKDSKIHLVLTNEMQDSYYNFSTNVDTSNKKRRILTYRQFLQDHPHVNNGMVYKMTENGLLSIKGLESDIQDSEKIIIFIPLTKMTG